jgi:hypothetical protein
MQGIYKIRYERYVLHTHLQYRAKEDFAIP